MIQFSFKRSIVTLEYVSVLLPMLTRRETILLDSKCSSVNMHASTKPTFDCTPNPNSNVNAGRRRARRVGDLRAVLTDPDEPSDRLVRHRSAREGLEPEQL